MFSENIQLEHLGTPMVLQTVSNPSKEDFFHSLRRGNEKSFYREKSSLNNVLPSYWPYSQNHLQSHYNSDPTISMPDSLSTPLLNDPQHYGNLKC